MERHGQGSIITFDEDPFPETQSFASHELTGMQSSYLDLLALRIECQSQGTEHTSPFAW